MDPPACAGYGVAGGRGVFFVLYVFATVASYEQLDNSEKLASKNAYLAALPRAVSALSPDIVVILFDDLGYGDVGFTGNRSIRTPYMDALAENGVVMTNYFSPAPVCSPSRAAMLTGRMAPRNGLTAVPFPKRIANRSGQSLFRQSSASAARRDHNSRSAKGDGVSYSDGRQMALRRSRQINPDRVWL